MLLLDISLPGIHGSQATGLIRERHPRTRILMLIVFAEQDRVFESIGNLGCGYLLMKPPPVRLLEAIQEVHQGGSPMSPEIVRKVVGLFQRTHQTVDASFRLTPHEVRLLRLRSKDHSCQSADQELHISFSTMHNYIRSIYEKLRVHSKSAAVGKALHRGLLA